MNKTILLSLAAFTALGASQALAGDRYSSRPPVTVSADLTAPWVMQLQRRPMAPGQASVHRNLPAGVTVRVAPAQRQVIQRTQRVDAVRTSAYVAQPVAKPQKQIMNPVFLPQEVSYDGPQKAGTIVIDTNQKFLFLVQANGTARRYGVGVGKPGFEWTGTHKITQKREWPDWRPPAEMIQRVREKEGRILPVHMAGGPANPLGARAMYLGSTLYRIHGTNAPWTIGQNVSSGCIRMRNEDVSDLYERVGVGTKVIVM